ncbi:MAG: thiamine pyrophosphate-dependent dehydrogenase E1 component subunit alpha [Chloroflexi bacterium]|nr:thiamine pyrophosphate-dependent dehydrogenase E1 component subunit alpha [Chloroflexota bacterium]
MDGESGIRVVGERGKHRPLGLSTEELLEMYSRLHLIRALDQRVWMLNRQGKVAIVSSCQGHEAAQIGSIWAMDRSRDLFYIYYRSLAGCITLGIPPKELLLGYMAKEGEPFSGARQFPLHGAYPKYRIVNVSNVVGASMPHAVGAALAAKMRREPTVVISYFGDGSTSEGEWHEAMNFAGVHRLPIIFFCENNRWAISVPQSRQMAVENVADRAAAYGMSGVVIPEGWDVLEVYRATREAVERVRSGAGPILLEAKVERLMPHTSDDDDRRYRPPEDLELAKQRDPLQCMRNYLVAEGLLTEEMDRNYQQRAAQEVNEATEFAEKAPLPDAAGLMERLYATPVGRSW